ncbi:hypothetical protein COT95_02720 [Candidatus Falkowbacteria bacterium CG10_big_fil_rev_8_21_14_0_10_37_6]|uniref:Uncharacterized protein n=1 Tax=Candidatus Falkowbacteria bacterium CG10_big_fil_rev_8_21_14_0_10_37_6 TaxID=1974563 RepID=A0A2H0V8Q4_9BACT|nr:MAG: hypothetical protein COT95_02720 [Candidatus Falkowbacteria bacterium CG10_big_fil_rev_8_21_14_0_10_37_6]
MSCKEWELPVLKVELYQPIGRGTCVVEEVIEIIYRDEGRDDGNFCSDEVSLGIRDFALDVKDVLEVIKNFFSKRTFTFKELEDFCYISPPKFNNDLDDPVNPVESFGNLRRHLNFLLKKGFLQEIKPGKFRLVFSKKVKFRKNFYFEHDEE